MGCGGLSWCSVQHMSVVGSVPGWLACGLLLVPGASAGELPVPLPPIWALAVRVRLSPFAVNCLMYN